MPFLDPDRILEVAQKFRDLSSPCRMCPRECMVDRLSGEIGYCGAGPLPSHSGILQHFGEEPPLVGIGGAGTIFSPTAICDAFFVRTTRLVEANVAKS